MGLRTKLLRLVGLPRLVGGAAGGEPAWLDTADLKRRIEGGEDVVVLDVRGADEFSGPLGHIPGARNIAIKDLPGRLGELAEVKAKPIALVCLTDMRSATAARLLTDAGFAHVSVLRGGMKRWTEMALEVAGRSPGA